MEKLLILFSIISAISAKLRDPHCPGGHSSSSFLMRQGQEYMCIPQDISNSCIAEYRPVLNNRFLLFAYICSSKSNGFQMDTNGCQKDLEEINQFLGIFITPSPASMFFVTTALINNYHIVLRMVSLWSSSSISRPPRCSLGLKIIFLTFARFLQSLGADLSRWSSAFAHVLSPITLNHFLRVNFGLTVGVLDSAVVPTNWLRFPLPPSVQESEYIYMQFILKQNGMAI